MAAASGAGGPPDLLTHHERRGYVAQHKLNGACNVIAVHPDRSGLVCMNRYAESHRAWEPIAASSTAFLGLYGAAERSAAAQAALGSGTFPLAHISPGRQMQS